MAENDEPVGERPTQFDPNQVVDEVTGQPGGAAEASQGVAKAGADNVGASAGVEASAVPDSAGPDSVGPDSVGPDMPSAGSPISDAPLAPRTLTRGTGATRRIGPIIVLGIVAVAAIGALYAGLQGATLYFRTVDEAVSQKAELGDRRFRMEGNLVAGSIEPHGDGVRFSLRSRGVTARVDHTGSEPAMFGDTSIPVVVEGHWAGEDFRSERILVKHDEDYVEANPERIADAEREARSEPSASTDGTSEANSVVVPPGRTSTTGETGEASPE